MSIEISNQKVFVGMSGGVDSSVAAYLLKEEGYDVVGVFLRCYNIDGCAERDAEDARRVAGKLNIPFFVWDFEKEYKEKVVEYMVDGYRQGITPNPDVICNREIKFGLFYNRAKSMGADFIATGHYVVREGRSLFIAKDKKKDQSYFLWALKPDQIEYCLFPVGNYLKPEIREIAKKAGLSTAEKKDSQGVCFLGNISVSDFLKDYIPEKKGDVLNTEGKKVGEHSGASFYTIGQRHLGINFEKPKNSNSTLPYFVSDKNIESNTLIVAEGEDNKALYKKELNIFGVNLISQIEFPCRVSARVRYRQPLANALLEDGGSGLKITFDEPQKFVAPGQSAVFYAPNGKMLGGGIIF